MRAKKREISAVYKTIRLQPDAFYDSRLIQIFFNKFTKQGKKSLAKKHIMLALSRYRRSIRRPRLFFALIRLFNQLHTHLILVSRRRGRAFINVPVPVRRNKREALGLHAVFKAIKVCSEYKLAVRIQSELSSLTFQPRQAFPTRTRNTMFERIYEERIYMNRRWK